MSFLVDNTICCASILFYLSEVVGYPLIHTQIIPLVFLNVNLSNSINIFIFFFIIKIISRFFIFLYNLNLFLIVFQISLLLSSCYLEIFLIFM